MDTRAAAECTTNSGGRKRANEKTSVKQTLAGLGEEKEIFMFNVIVWFVLVGAFLSSSRAENNAYDKDEEEALSDDTFRIDDDDEDGEPAI